MYFKRRRKRERVGEGHRKFSICWFTLRTATTVRARCQTPQRGLLHRWHFIRSRCFPQMQQEETEQSTAPGLNSYVPPCTPSVCYRYSVRLTAFFLPIPNIVMSPASSILSLVNYISLLQRPSPHVYIQRGENCYGSAAGRIQM